MICQGGGVNLIEFIIALIFVLSAITGAFIFGYKLGLKTKKEPKTKPSKTQSTLTQEQERLIKREQQILDNLNNYDGSIQDDLIE